MIAIGVSAVPVFVRVARAETLVVGTEVYIAAAVPKASAISPS
jgi:peptide/nickel transport system permease protein